MVNGVFGEVFFMKDAWNFGTIIVSGKNNSPVIFFTFIILNAPIYGVFNLSFVKFFVDKNVLFFGLIVTGFFLRLIFFDFLSGFGYSGSNCGPIVFYFHCEC